MTGAKIALDAASPAADESVIECAADHRTGDRDQPRDPLFSGFFSQLHREAFGDARRELFNDLFFRELFADVDAGGGRGGNPEFALLIGTASFKSIEKGEALNQAQRDDGQYASIGDKGDQAAQTESCTFGQGHALRVAN